MKGEGGYLLWKAWVARRPRARSTVVVKAALRLWAVSWGREEGVVGGEGKGR